MTSTKNPDAPFGYATRSGKPRKSPAIGGRPEEISDELIQKLVDALTLFAPVDTACAFAGISKDTFYRWLKKGARQKRKGESTKYTRFSDRVQNAMASAELGCLSVIVEAARGKGAVVQKDANGKPIVVQPAQAPQWQAAAWMAERRNPRQYARRTYRIEEEQGHVSAVGAVVPYQVRMPEVDPLEPPAEPKIEPSDD